MGRVSARRAAEMRREWAEALAGVVRQAPARVDTTFERGTDYSDAPQQWVCNRKKAYPDELTARRVATDLNDLNQTRKARPGFFGVVVTPYLCRRCGRWHLGR